jgi:RNA polymerase sigma factor (sigma-70 family)
MQDDAALLRRYAEDHSEEAFTELVNRHLGLVYHAALRQCGGNRHHAEEVAQLVFTDLARKADVLSRRPLLVAWLHTSARYAASHLHRAEARRLAREHAAFAMHDTEAGLAPEPAVEWDRLRPLIDEALQSLGERDRAAVLLRFFENRSYAELAATLSVSEDAARVRTNRALEKLRSALARRGLVSTSAALSLALAQPALAAAPAGLAAQIAASSLAAATFAGASTGLVSAAFLATVKIAGATTAAITLLSLGVILHQNASAPPEATATRTSALSAAELAAILHPARLTPADADLALAAYLALPALAENAAQTEFLERSARLRALLTVLPAEHHARLLAATSTRIGVPEDRLRRIAFAAWTELAAPAAARWAAAQENSPTLDGDQRAELATEAALAWARADFNAAYAWATALRPDLARHIGGRLLARLVRTDAARALTLARAGDLAYFDAVRPGIFEAWLEHDPAAAFQTLGAEMFAAPGDRVSLPRHLARWAWRDPQGALAWLDTRAPGEPYQRANQLGSLISDFADKNPPPDFAAFAAALTSRAESGFGRNRLEQFLRSWMERDSSAALRWLDTLPDASLREEIVRESVLYAAYDNPRDILTLARRLPADAKRAQAIDKILGDWSRKAPDDALAWLESAEGAELAGTETAQVVRIGIVAQKNPAAALAAWNAIGSEDTRRGIAPALARAWASTEPDAAAAWLFAQIPEGPNPNDPETYRSFNPDEREVYRKRMEPFSAYSQVYDTISAKWIARDPDDFIEWAQSLPSSVQQRSALHSLSWAAARQANADQPDPAKRLALIATLRDPDLRGPLMRDYILSWHRYDEKSARRWAMEHQAESLLEEDEKAAR